jgi:hypothetical protein
LPVPLPLITDMPRSRALRLWRRRAVSFADKSDPVSVDDEERIWDGSPPDPSIKVPFLISSRVAVAMTTASLKDGRS